ncbi:hypothetical protein GE061_010165 [Apolygus lucorum]|uniref:Uncharacterized protein n=1 Tax=Apolygus lucorum TaxID=248454 RepID=A0A6A4KHK1_APOLU|nr:hypothetical protein GE061_010165 [Apolygus lucorum]
MQQKSLRGSHDKLKIIPTISLNGGNLVLVSPDVREAGGQMRVGSQNYAAWTKMRLQQFWGHQLRRT